MNLAVRLGLAVHRLFFLAKLCGVGSDLGRFLELSSSVSAGCRGGAPARGRVPLWSTAVRVTPRQNCFKLKRISCSSLASLTLKRRVEQKHIAHSPRSHAMPSCGPRVGGGARRGCSPRHGVLEVLEHFHPVHHIGAVVLVVEVKGHVEAALVVGDHQHRDGRDPRAVVA